MSILKRILKHVSYLVVMEIILCTISKCIFKDENWFCTSTAFLISYNIGSIIGKILHKNVIFSKVFKVVLGKSYFILITIIAFSILSFGIGSIGLYIIYPFGVAVVIAFVDSNTNFTSNNTQKQEEAS